MIIPAIGVIIGNHNSSTLPGWQMLQAIDGVHQEGLLVKRVRVASMTILISRGLEETYRWHMPILNGCPEVRQIILVIGLVGFADHVYRRGRQVVRVGR